MVARPGSRPVPSLARELPCPLSAPALRRSLRGGWDELAGLGRIRAVGLRAAFDLVGELGEPCLGLSIACDSRPVDEPLVGRALDLRRGLAQQPSCLPNLGPPWPEVVGSRFDLCKHLADE